MSLYVQPHRSQFEAGASSTTRCCGCTWTSGANGVAATTGGKQRPTPDAVHNHLAHAEETQPGTPGWSLADLERALGRMGIEFHNHGGDGWARAIELAEAGHYLVLQGDSDEFSNATCSGKFDGDHAVGWHPKHKLEGGVRWWWINDPICSTGRWEREATLKRYASNLNATIQFGAFAGKVPETVSPPPPPPPVHLHYGARKLPKATPKRIRVPAGHKARVRRAPRTTARVLTNKANGTHFVAYQVTAKGQQLAGSSTWYGNRLGNRWVHSSAF